MSYKLSCYQSFCAMSNFMERRIHCLVKMQIYCITQIKKLIWRWKFSNLLPFDFVLVWYCSSASRPNWMWTKRTDKHSEGTYFCICILSSVVFVFCEWSIGYEQRTQTRHMVWAYRHKEREGHGLIKRTVTLPQTSWHDEHRIVWIRMLLYLYFVLSCICVFAAPVLCHQRQVEADPMLLENFGFRNIKRKTDIVHTRL